MDVNAHFKLKTVFQTIQCTHAIVLFSDIICAGAWPSTYKPWIHVRPLISTESVVHNEIESGFQQIYSMCLDVII